MAHFLSRVIQRNASRLAYSEYGVPSEVVRLEEFPDPEVSGPKDVVVKMLAAAIHPADINTIQGNFSNIRNISISIEFLLVRKKFD